MGSGLVAIATSARYKHNIPKHTMDVSKIVRELQGASSLVAAQQAAGLDKTAAIQSQVKSWTRRFTELPCVLDADDIEQITLAVSKGPWDVKDRRSLASLLTDKQAGMGGSATKGSGNRRAMQHCPNFENYLTQDEWRKIRSGAIPASIIAMMALRGWLVGIECAGELSTLKRMVQILAWVTRQNLSQAQVKQYKEQLQAAIKSHGSKRPNNVKMPYIVHYPASASDLPSAILKYAYGSSPEEQAVDVTIPELDTILGSAKIRPGASLDMSWLAAIPPQLQEFVRNMVTHHSGGMAPSSPPAGCGITYGSSWGASGSAFLSPHDQRQAATQLAISAPDLPVIKPQAICNGKADHTQAGATGSLEEMENNLLTGSAAVKDTKKALAEAKKKTAATKKADALAKAKAGAKAKPLPAANKKPAAAEHLGAQPVAAAGPLKRPSSAVPAPFMVVPINMEDIFGELRASFGKITRGAFVTKAYKRALHRIQKAKTHSAEESLQWARENHSRASALWDELSASP